MENYAFSLVVPLCIAPPAPSYFTPGEQLSATTLSFSTVLLQWRRYRGAGGCLGPPLFIQGGRAPLNYLTTGLSKVPKLPYYWLGICTVRRESISKLSSSSRRGALPLFSSPRDESSGKRTPHEY